MEDKFCPKCETKMYLEIERCINGKKWWKCPECGETLPYEKESQKVSDITCSLCGSKMNFIGKTGNHLMFSCSNDKCSGAFLIHCNCKE